MKGLHLAARLQRLLGGRGIAGSLRRGAGRISRSLRTIRIETHPFDLQHGVRTTALIEGGKLATGHKHDRYATCYLASHPSMVTGSIDAWRGLVDGSASGLPLEAYTFLDLGAGMGRAVMLASLYPFRQIVGVERNPRLCERARRNLSLWLRTPRPCGDLRIATCDATEYPWPRAPLAIYMFNPFDQPVIVRLIESLELALAEGAGPIDLLYVHPVAAACLNAHPRVRLLGSTHSFLTEQERLFDPFNDPGSPSFPVDCAFYRLVPG